MPLTSLIRCPHCDRQYQLSADYVATYGGQQITCDQCHRPLTLPTSIDPAAGLILPAPRARTTPQPPAPDAAPPDPPAEAPPATATARRPARCWAEGDKLVIERGARLPPYCVRCDADAPYPHTLHLVRWSEQASESHGAKSKLLWTLFASTAMRVRLGLCPRHLARRRRGLIAAVPIICLAPAGAIALATYEPLGHSDWAALPLIILTLAPFLACAWIVSLRATLTPEYIDHRIAKLSGASPDFLKRLPPPPHAQFANLTPDPSAFDEIQ